MAEEFKIIETQEQLDSIIKGRLEREREKLNTQISEMTQKYESQTAEAQKQIGELTQALNAAREEKSGFDKLLEEKDATIKNYELHSVKTQIAHELGLSYEAVDFLKGSTEEEIRQSAESLKDLVGTKTAPLAAEVPIPDNEKDAKSAALRSMVRNMQK